MPRTNYFLKNKSNLPHIVEYGFHKSVSLDAREEKPISKEIAQSKSVLSYVNRGIFKLVTKEDE